MGNVFDLKQLFIDLKARKGEESELIKKMDSILLGEERETESEEIVGSLVERLKTDLREILASLQSEYSSNGRENIKGYKENFFNEIIQNIEDLDPVEKGVKQEENVKIDITVSECKESFEICCKYTDKGFSCDNLFGFCNIASGAKGETKDGKYGIGIKAVFSAASQIMVDSNFSIVVVADGEKINIERFERNSEWDGAHTQMKFVIPRRDKEEEEGWINIEKLSHIIMDDGSAFLSDDPKMLLFDCRALLFTSKIKCIKINDWEIRADRNDKSENSEYSIWTLKVKNESIRFESNEQYLVYTRSDFDSKNSTAKSFAFCFTKQENRKYENRIYSKYFVKKYNVISLKETGILVNVDKKYTNSSRNDVGDSEDKINDVHNAILKELKDVFLKFSQESILKEKMQIREALSIVYHDCLWAYRDDFEQAVDFGIFEKVVDERAGNGFLPKMKSETDDNNGNATQKYVVYEEEKEKYTDYDFLTETEDIAKEKKRVYQEVFEAGEVITYNDVVGSCMLSSSIKNLYEFVNDNKGKNKILRCILNYHDSVSSFIGFRVFGSEQDMEKWQAFLDKIKERYKNEKDDTLKIIRKLLGAYHVLEFLDETGCLNKQKLTVLDYLFLEEETDNNDLVREIIAVYEEKYGELKSALRENIAEFTVIEPKGTSRRGWNGKPDYTLSTDEEKKLDKKIVFQLLDLIRDQDLYKNIKRLGRRLILTNDKNISENLQFRSKYWDDYRTVKVCKVFFWEKSLEENSCSIKESIKYQPVLDPIKRTINVQEKSTNINDLISLFNTIVTRKKNGLAEYSVTLEDINTEGFENCCDSEYSDFVRLVTGGRVADIILGQLDVPGIKSNVTILLDAERKIRVKLSSTSSFETWPRSNLQDVLSKNGQKAFVFFAGSQRKESALSDAVKEMGLGGDVEEQIEGYISMNAIGNPLSGYAYERVLKTNSSEMSGAQLCDGKLLEKSLKNSVSDMSVSEKKKIMLARGSYNGCCPICKKPLMGEAKDSLAEAAAVAKLFTVRIQDGRFFQSCCCANCLEWLRKTAIESRVEEGKLKFSMKNVSGEKETISIKKVVELSNVNQIIGLLES